jgi:asparagine synthase (glutamine-hydrolysing)
MAERMLAAIHDPRTALGAREAERRVRTALEEGGSLQVRAAGAITAGWTGPTTVVTDNPVAGGLPFVVVDGDARLELGSQPARWLASLHAARGGFAVIAWHRDQGMVARDHLGARPLFLTTDGPVVYLASEVANLLALLPRRPAPDRDALALFVAGLSAPDGGTLFAGVRALPAAHALLLDSAGARMQRFWRAAPRLDLAGATAEEAADVLRRGVRAAVRRRGGGAAEAGVLLSGGLDSSVVLACAAVEAREAGAPPPPAFSAVFPDHPRLDERTASGAMAERWGSEWTTVAAGRGPLVPEGLAHVERWQLPLQHPGGTFFRPVLEEAARRGVRVLLDGEGGDDLFGCEPLLLADRLRAGDLRGAARLGRLLPGTGGRLDARQARVVLRNWVLPGLLAPRVIERLRRARGGDRGAPGWLLASGRDVVVGAGAAFDKAWWRGGRPRWRAHLSWVLSDGHATLGMHDHLRRTSRPAGVADSHPFFDVDLIELVLSLPPELAFDPHHDRALLRGAMVGLLPDAVRLRRDKVYFDALRLDALTGPDRAAIDRTLGGALELAVVADPALVRALWRDGPERHPGGWRVWSAEVWRAFAAETWLRREAGAE